LGIDLVLTGHDNAPFEQVDLVVVSPGIPPLPQLDRCVQRGVEVIGELELGWRFCKAPVLAVGGTNGKSTTTALLAQLLLSQGLKVFAGGNLGSPLCEAVGHDYDALVVEVSSFQLERAPSFQPKISVLLNVTDDHLDRYDSFQHYADAKGNAFVRQERGDFAIVPAGDPICLQQALRGHGRLIRFGQAGAAGVDSEIDYAVGSVGVIETLTGEQFDLTRSALHGTHNWLNAAAAVAAARRFGAAPESIREGLQVFKPLHHRMALAGEIAGVRYYDDSKGTNVGAAVTAVGGVPESRVVLIAGGRDKLGSYAPLRAALEKKGRACVLIGEAADKIAAALQGAVVLERAASMDEAVRIAAKLAQKGDAVLLSPACSSFDMFSGYAARGDAFVQAVKGLTQGESS
jgi:UDP-N-acetylmuramoylalanine--D-glutamate ligase